jgi:transposase-like protein
MNSINAEDYRFGDLNVCALAAFTALKMTSTFDVLFTNPNSTHTMQLSRSPVRARQIGGYVCKSCSNQTRRQRRTYATEATPEIYDVVCVGGGPAGLSFIAGLSMVLSTFRTIRIVTD